MLRTRDHLYVMMDVVKLSQLRVQMFVVSSRQLKDGVHTGLLKQLGILPSNPLNSKKIRLVHPSQKLVMSDARLGLQFLAALRCCRFLKKRLYTLNASSLQLLAVNCSDSFDFVDVRHSSGRDIIILTS